MIQAHYWAKLLRFAMTAAMAGAFLVLFVIGTAGQALSIESQVAVHASTLTHLNSSQERILTEMQATNVKLGDLANRITRIEMAGAVCGVILTILQAFASLTGRKLRTTSGGD